MEPCDEDEQGEGGDRCNKPDRRVREPDDEVESADDRQPAAGRRLVVGPRQREVVDRAVRQAEEDDAHGERQQLEAS